MSEKTETVDTTGAYTAQTLADTLGVDYNKANGFIKLCEALGVLTSCGTEARQGQGRGKRARLYQVDADLLARLSDAISGKLANGPVILERKTVVTVVDQTAAPEPTPEPAEEPETTPEPTLEATEDTSDEDFSFETDFSDEPTQTDIVVPSN